jgi:hypothetical protein
LVYNRIEIVPVVRLSLRWFVNWLLVNRRLINWRFINWWSYNRRFVNSRRWRRWRRFWRRLYRLRSTDVVQDV